MMLPQDSLKLALTKFKTRRIRLGIAVVVSGILFVAFATTSFVVRGTIASIDGFSKEGFAGRYITQPSLAFYGSDDITGNKDMIAKAKDIDKKLVADKKAEAKRLGIEYNPDTEHLAVTTYKDQSVNNGQPTDNLDFMNPNVRPLIHDAIVKSSQKYIDALEASRQDFDTKGVYKGITLAGGGYSGPPAMGAPETPTITVVKNGVEQTSSQQNQGLTQQGIDSFVSGWTLLDDDLMQPFLLPDQNTTISKDGSIPLVAPFSAVEEMLHMTKLPDGASSQVKLDRMKEVRSKAANLTFSVCLRNQTSNERLQLAVSQQQELTNSKNNKDYQKPDLMYDKSSVPCADVVTTRDVRTAEAKALTAKQDQFDQKFGKVAAAQRQATFKIIGVVADPPSFGGMSVESIIGQLLTSNLGMGWFTPRSALSGLPEYKTFVDSQDEVFNYGVTYYVEHADAATSKKFAKALTCIPTSFINGPGIPKECEEKKQYYYVQSFGSNSVAMEELRNGFAKYFVRALLVASVFSALILMGTVGRVMADGRRETAVFRAIGAKRLDIAQIYLTYVVMIGATIAAFVVGLGYVLANVVDQKYSGGLTVKALLAYNAKDMGRQFQLRTFDPHDIGLLVLVVLAASLLSALLPLLTNLKRNPIADMRDDR